MIASRRLLGRACACTLASLVAWARIWSVLVATWGAASAYAQGAGPPMLPDSHSADTYSFRRLGVDEGLSSWRVSALLQDKAGYVWIATPNGLDRYDGYQVKTYQSEPSDLNSLSDSFVSTLYEDRSGRLWVGTRSGLDVYDPTRDGFDRTLGADVVTSVNTLLEDHTGTLWIGTFGNGLYAFNPDTQVVTAYRHSAADATSLSSNNVNDVFEDRAGTLWIATLAGLDRLDRDTGGFTAYREDARQPLNLSDDAVWDILEDHAGVLWVSTDGGGLDRFMPDTGQFVAYRHDPADPTSLSDDRLSTMFEDERGDLWVGTFSGGVSILDPERRSFTVARHDLSDSTSLSNNSVTFITADRSGLIWVGTAGGVNIYDPLRRTYTLYQQDPSGASGLASNNVTAVHQDAAGRLWVGTRDRGLDLLDRHTGAVSHVSGGSNGQALSSAFVWDVTSDHSGAIWIATYGVGLYRLDPGSGRIDAFRHDPGNPRALSDDTVTDLFLDHRGTLWVGTRSGGLNRFDRDSGDFTVFRHDEANSGSLSHDTIRSIAEDAAGFIWVGTAGGGLNHLDPATGTFTHFRHDGSDRASLGADGAYALQVDRGGGLWVGLAGAGVDRFEPSPGSTAETPGGTFVHYRQRDGLASDEVLAMLEDGSATDAAAGNIWIITGRGLTRIDAQSHALQWYGSVEGLPSVPFTGGHDATADGRLLLGTVDGLIDFDPRAAQGDAYVPPIVFTDFLLANNPVVPNASSPLARPIDVTDRVQLGWNDRVISIEFAALGFRGPGLSHYRYILEGFDKQWTEVDSTRRLVTYTNLEPGTYVFRVTGSNASGVWNPTGRALTLVITPPWWDTWWFRSVAIVAVATGLVLVYVWRVRALSAQRRLLETLVVQRTEALNKALEAQKVALDTRDIFLRTLAHDLKTPLTALSWHVQTLARRQREGRLEPAMLDQSLRDIERNSTDAAAAIDELHDLTRLAAGSTLPLHIETVDLVALAQQLVAARLESSRHAIELISDLDTLMVRADRARLTRVVANLLENATKYSPAGGQIIVRVEREVKDGVGSAVLCMQDQGIGIPSADLPHVFDRYRRGSNLADIPGEGLGLASARQLVELHGGRIDVESREGVGSTFRIWLPLAPAPSEAGSPAPGDTSRAPAGT